MSLLSSLGGRWLCWALKTSNFAAAGLRSTPADNSLEVRISIDERRAKGTTHLACELVQVRVRVFWAVCHPWAGQGGEDLSQLTVTLNVKGRLKARGSEEQAFRSLYHDAKHPFPYCEP